MSSTPPWLDKGDNAWQLTAATLVALQSVPGLVVLYAGIVKRKWAVNSAFMAFYAFAAVLICWVLWAYNAAFGKQMLPFVGVPGPVVTMNNELSQALLPASGVTANFPLSTMGKLLFHVLLVVTINMSYCDYKKSTFSSSLRQSL
jgi:Amt family ammonium transporter